MVEPVSWVALGSDLLPGRLRLLDQTVLPECVAYVELADVEAIRTAIKRLVVRGAPAIGCAAALGLAAACQHSTAPDTPAFLAAVRAAAARLASSRPTAVNLAWAIRRSVAAAETAAKAGGDVAAIKVALVREGLAILDEDRQLCHAIGAAGLAIFEGRRGMAVLTHCNAGGLATSGYGTALAPVYAAQAAGLAPRVFADETRPLLQGSRLTAWELQQAGVEVTVVCDNMAAALLRRESIGAVVVGADRIAANGDTANKIGTYGVAVLARHHGVPFYVAAPYSTVDMALDTGAGIPIEERDPDEVRRGFGRLTAPATVAVWNPAFDVTPAHLIAGIITEHGILRPPFAEAIRAFMAARTAGGPA